MTCRVQAEESMSAGYRFPVPFERIGCVQRLRLIASGFRHPAGSGPRKYALSELSHLVSWTCALCMPFLFIVVLQWVTPPRRHAADRPVIRLLTVAPDVDPLPIEPEPDEPLKWEPSSRAADIVRTLTSTPADQAADLASERPLARRAPILPPPTLVRSPLTIPLPYRTGGLGRRSDVVGKIAHTPSEGAVLRALRWLQAEQGPDGAWQSPGPAMTGLALLCFLGHGEIPGESIEFGDTVRRGIEWLIAHQEPDGRFAGSDAHEYSLPIAAYALAEAFALTHNPNVREAAERSLNVIIQGQNADGGWNYNCRPSTRNDTSYTGWCVQALKAAKIARLEHPALDACMVRAVAGVRRNAAPAGGFGYTSPGAGGLTGVGVLGMQILGAGRAAEARQGLAWLDRVTFAWDDPWGSRPLYYWYYITQAKFHAGGSTWDRWDPAFARELMRSQRILPANGDGALARGYWDSPGGKEAHGTVYSTTLCTLMLEVYYRYLGTYQPVEAPAEVEPEDAPGAGQVTVSFPDRRG